MKIVIDIPNELYKGIEERDGSLETEYVCDELMKAVDNGTVLPKGHGRLIDVDAATKDINAFMDAFGIYTDNMGKYNVVCAAPIVIEADKDGDADGRENG